MPNCLKCKRSSEVVSHGKDEWFCNRCKIIFDNDPDEGGDFDNKFPDRRLLRAEKSRERRGNGR